MPLMPIYVLFGGFGRIRNANNQPLKPNIPPTYTLDLGTYWFDPKFSQISVLTKSGGETCIKIMQRHLARRDTELYKQKGKQNPND